MNRRRFHLIIGEAMASPTATDFTSLCGELDALIEGPSAHDEADRARLERTLTDGYARAHALEAEQLRIERRIGKLASEMSEQDREQKADELAELSLKLSRASVDLRHLRKLLAAARRRTSAAA
jgi:hypothetical protein